MAYNKYKFYDYNSPYKDNKAINNARSTLLAIQPPTYTNTYGNQIKGIYNNIKNRKDFDYNPANDAAYQQYAAQYRALVGLAVAGNQAQAQELTGGYGSTYAPEVARQGQMRLNEGVTAAQPAFLQLAQNKYDLGTEQLYNQYNAAAGRRDAALEDYSRQADIYNDRYGRAADMYNALEDRGYERYMNNRDFNYAQNQMNISQDQANKEYKLQKYDTYNQLAGNKCADFQNKGDNKGMKAYLKGLVKKGKITQYMADNLYKQYKYIPPEPKAQKQPTQTKQTKQTNPEGVKDGVFYGDTTTNNFLSKYGDKGKGKIDALLKAGKLTDYQAAWLKEYYKQNPPKSEFNGNNKTSDFIYNHRNIESGKKLENEVKKYYNSGKLTADEAAYLYAWYQNHSHNYDVNDKNDTNKNGKLMWEHLPNTHGGRVTR